MNPASENNSSPAPPFNRRVAVRFLVIFGALLPCLVTWIYFVALPESLFAKILYGLQKILQLALPVCVLVVLQKGALRDCLPLRLKQPLRSLAWGAGSGLVIAGAMFGVYAIPPVRAYLFEHAGAIHSKVATLGILEYYIPFGIFLAGFHSLLEEYYWRNFIYRQLEVWIGGWRAHMAAGMAFAAHHYVVLGAYFDWKGTLVFGTFVGVGGMVWSFLLARTNSMLAGWISHLLADVAILTIGYWLIFSAVT